MWERIADLLQSHVAAFRDAQRAGKHVGRVFEDSVHFVMALDEKSAALKLHAIRILDRLARLNAQHHVLRVRVIFAEIVAVIRGHQRKAQVFLQAKQGRMDAMFHLQTLILNLEKKIVLAEDVAVPRRCSARSLVLVVHQEFG